MIDEQLTLKEMSVRFDVTPRTLRHYEYIELLQPEKHGRTRLYGPRECARLELIKRGRRFGFSLEEMRQWLLLYDVDPSNRLQTQTFVGMADRQIEELQHRRVQLDETIDELRRLRQLSLDALKK